MRELTKSEVKQVSGGLTWTEGGLAVLGLSATTPLTFLFGFPIAAAMLYVGDAAGE